jgi:hypothetical protein
MECFAQEFTPTEEQLNTNKREKTLVFLGWVDGGFLKAQVKFHI